MEFPPVTEEQAILLIAAFAVLLAWLLLRPALEVGGTWG